MAPKNRKKKANVSASDTASEDALRKYSEDTSKMSFIPMLPVGENRTKIPFSKKHYIHAPEKSPSKKQKPLKTTANVPDAQSNATICVNRCEELLRNRRKSKKSITDLPTIPEGGCVKGCKKKDKTPADKSKKKAGRNEEEGESSAEDKKETIGNETEECDPQCGPAMIDRIYNESKKASRDDDSDHRADLCQALCCPPTDRSETELLEQFVTQLLADAETSSVTAPECLCNEVTRWMRYFMCGCDLNKDATVQLADAVAEADSRIPGLLKALTDELRAQAEKAREQPKDRKLAPQEQRVRWYVAAKALRAAKFLDEAADRWRLAAALKVAADMAAAEYEEILRKQLDVMMELLQKRLEKDWKHRTRPYLVDLRESDFFHRSSRASL